MAIINNVSSVNYALSVQAQQAQDQTLAQKLQDLILAYQSDMNDPTKLKADMVKIIFFLEEHKGAIERLCSQEGWPADGNQGYETFLKGALNSIFSYHRLLKHDPSEAAAAAMQVNSDLTQLAFEMANPYKP